MSGGFTRFPAALPRLRPAAFSPFFSAMTLEREVASLVAQEHSAALRRGVERMQRAAQARRGAPKGAIPHYQMDSAVYWNGVMHEGLDAMRPGSDYMKDMQRRHPWIGDPHDAPGSAHRPNLVFRQGRWWRRVPGTRDYELEPKGAKAPWWCT